MRGKLIDSGMRAWRPLLAVLAALSVIGGASAFGAPSDPGSARAGDPTVGVGAEVSEREQQRIAQQQAFRESAQGRRERAASRAAYRGQSKAEALATTRGKFPELVADHPAHWPALGKDEQLAGWLGESAAVVKEADGTRGLIESSTPLVGTSPGGDRGAVDLGLTEQVDSFAPQSAPVRTEFPRRADGVLSFPDQSFTVSLDGATGSDAQRTSNTLFFANALTDTDALLEPTSVGAETSFVLRSPASPTRLALRFDLAPGQRLQLIGGDEGPGSAEVVDHDKTIATVSPPAAVDAQGQPLDISYQLQGQRLMLDLGDTADVAYPIAIDPTIGVYDTNGLAADPNTDPLGYTWHGWTQGSNTSIAPCNPPAFVFFSMCQGPNGNYTSGGGLYIKGVAGQSQYNNFWAEWLKYARNGSYIYRYDATNMAHTANNSQVLAGINCYPCAPPSAASGGWELGGYLDYRTPNLTGTPAYAAWGATEQSDVQFFCVDAPAGWDPNTGCPPGPSTHVHDGNFAVFGLKIFGPTASSPQPMAAMGSAATYSSDRNAPTVSTPTHTTAPQSSTWVESYTDTVGLTASETDGAGHPFGLGMGAVSASGPGLNGKASDCVANGPPPQGAGPNATGAHDLYDGCASSIPGRWGYTAPEGIDTYTASATDIVGNRSVQPDKTWTVKVDSTPPTINALSGTLYDHRNQPSDHRNEGLYDPSYSLSVAASDGTAAAPRSGVKSVDIQVNGSQKAHLIASCAGQDSCSWTSPPWTFNSDDYSDGDYTITVVVKDWMADQAGVDASQHTTSQNFQVTVDRRGDIYHAQEYDSNATNGGELLGEEWAQLGTQNMRHESAESIETRDLTSCLTDVTGCAEDRLRTRYGDVDPTQADAYAVTSGTSHSDPRMTEESDLLSPANSDLGLATSTGAISNALQPWQTPPPAHGLAYELYESSSPATVDGADSSVVHRLWVDSTTKMPLHELTLYGARVEGEVFYSYDRGRLTSSELPADEFAVPAPSQLSSENDTALPLVDPLPPGPDPLPDDPATESKLFREQFGLRSDDAFVQSTLNSSQDVALATHYGVPLEASEVADLNQRLAVQDALGAIDDWGAAHPAVYGDMYVDQAAGGLVYVGFTSDPSGNLQTLKSAFPYPDRLRAFTATRTSSELSGLEDQITSDWDAGTLDAYQLNTLGVDPESNSVVATSPIANPALESQLQARYGSGVRLEMLQTDLSSTPEGRQIPPVDGGLDVAQPGSHGDLRHCTSAFGAFDRRTIRGRAYKHYYSITAGHCSERRGNAAIGKPWQHLARSGNFKTFGHTSGTTTYGSTPRADALSINIRARFVSAEVYYHVTGSSGDHYRAMTSAVRRTHSGELVCHAGASSVRIHCGSITRYNLRAGGAGLHFKPMTEVSFHGRCDTRFGDSGSPVFRGNGAIGLSSSLGHKHCGKDGRGYQMGEYLYFSQIDEVLKGLNVRLFTP